MNTVGNGEGSLPTGKGGVGSRVKVVTEPHKTRKREIFLETVSLFAFPLHLVRRRTTTTNTAEWPS